MKTFFALALLVPMLALADNGQALDLGKVVSQQKQIRSDVLASKDYRGLNESQRTELLSRQDSLLRMLEGKETAADLTEDQRVSAFNDLEWIEATLNKAESERMICRRERTIGSNRVTRICRTAAQMQRDREAAKEHMTNSGACFEGVGGVSCRDKL